MADYTLSAKITGDASGLEKAFTSAQKSLDNMAKKMESVGKKLMPITGAITGVGAASGKMALDFQDSMANINTLLDDDTHLKGYEDSIKALSNETGLSIDTMSSGMYQAISSLGDGGAETEKVFTTMAKSAKAGGAEVADSVALISSGMKGYNQVNGETAQKISDLAFQTAKLGVTTFPEMASSMQELFPLADSLNWSYEDLFGSMATLTGVTGNTAGVSTQLKNVFAGLMSPTKGLSELIKEYGYDSAAAMLESEGLAGVLRILREETGGQADELAQLFSSQDAIVALTALTGSQFDTFNDKLKAMQDATGATQAAYDKLNTSGDKIRVAFNQIKNAGMDLGLTLMDMLAPSILTMSDKISQATTWFTNLEDSTKRTIIVVGGIVAAIGPLLLIMSKIVTGIGGIIAIAGKLTILINPITAIIAAIAGLALGFRHLMQTNDAFRDRVLSAWNVIQSKLAGLATVILPVLKSVVVKARETFEGIGQSLSPIFSEIPSKLSAVFSSIGPTLKSVFDSIVKVFSPIADAVMPALQGLKDVFLDIFDQIRGCMSGDGLDGNNILITITGFMLGLNPVAKMLLSVFAQIGPQIGDTFTQIIAIIGPVIAQIITMVGTLASQVVPLLVTAFTTIAPVISQTISTIASVIASFLPVIVSIIQSIVRAIGTLLPVIMNVANALIQIITQVIQVVLPIIGEIITMIGSLIAQLAPFIAMLVGQLGPIITTIASVVSNLISAILPVVISLIHVIMSAIQALLPVIMTIINAVMQVASNVISIVLSVVTTVLSALSPIISFIGGMISTIISIVSPIISFIANVIASVIAVIQPIISIVSGIITTLVNAAGSIFRGIITIVTEVFSRVSSFISTTINTVSNVISTVTGVVSTVFNTVYQTVSSVMNRVSDFIEGIFDGIKNAWDGLTGFVRGVFDGVSNAVDELVNHVKGFVNGIIRNINGAIDLINNLPGVSIGAIPYLLHGTDNWSGGFARMNEGGRGELTYLPDGTQVIPHDISVKYAREAARTNTTGGSEPIDYQRLIEGLTSAMSGVSVRHVSTLNGRVVVDEMLPLMDRKMGVLAQKVERGR